MSAPVIEKNVKKCECEYCNKAIYSTYGYAPSWQLTDPLDLLVFIKNLARALGYRFFGELVILG